MVLPHPRHLPFLHRLATFALALTGFVLSPWLLIFARTFRGRVVGLAGASFQVFFMWLLEFYYRFFNLGELYCWVCFYLVCLFFLAVSVAFQLKPKNQDGLLNDLITLSHPVYRGHFISKVFWPEEDWLWFGVLLGTHLDWRVNRTRGAEIRARVQGVLEDMRHVGVYKHCHTPWVHVFDSTIDVFPTCVIAVPEQPPRGAVIFLHGHGGNTLFQAFLLREFARRYRLVVVCPSFSYGPWELPNTRDVLFHTWELLLHSYSLQPDKTFLAGLSQGGAGVAVAAGSLKDRIAGLIFLSPTMILQDLSAPSFVAAWQGREVLVIHGENDRHVTKKSVDAGITTMMQHGITVQASFYPHADHSLFLLDTEAVLSEVGAYCERHLPKVPDDGTHPVT
jgi:predicted esterase